MGTKKENGMAWVKVDERVRHRLNLYKIMLGITNPNITDQSAAIAALLDNAGAPPVPATDHSTQQTEAVAQ